MKSSKIQNKWDKWLIKGWYSFRNMYQVYYMFTKECCPEYLRDGYEVDAEGLTGFLVANNVRRSTWVSRAKGDYLSLFVFRQEVRGVIAEESPTLSNALHSEKVNRLEIILNINNFKWRKVKVSNKDKAKMNYIKTKQAAFVPINARSLAENQWSHTK